MKHFVYCILYGFRKDIPEWEDKDSKHKLANKQYYSSKDSMDENEIEYAYDLLESFRDFRGKKPVD